MCFLGLFEVLKKDNDSVSIGDFLTPATIVVMQLLGKGLDHLLGWNKSSNYAVADFDISVIKTSDIDEDGNIEYILMNNKDFTLINISQEFI